MFTVYVLKNQLSGKIYIGQTKNLEQRLKYHNKELPTKKTGYTSKNKGKWKVIYQEKYSTRKEVMKREKKLKSYRGREYIKKNVLGR